MTTPHIIGVYGQMGSGKDHLTDRLISYFKTQNQKAVKIAFADSLKEELQAMIDDRKNKLTIHQLSAKYDFPLYATDTLFNVILPADLKDVSVHNKTDSIRKAFQFFGDIRRSQKENYFAEKTIDLAKKLNADGYIVIINDMRFQNEYNVMTNHNALLIRLDVSTSTLISRINQRDGFEPSLSSLQHPSEISLFKPEFTFDIVIDEHDQEAKTDLNKIINKF